MLADGDGEADIHPAAGGDESVGVEAAVGPHGELPAAPGVANPAHRFTQEVGGAPGGVGPALAQPGHQHVAGSGGDGQQRVIAPLAGIAVVAGALLGQSVGLADRRIKVDGQLDFTQNPGKVMDDITFVRSHWWLVSEGFSLSTANSDVQKLPATLYHRIADSLAYAA